MSNWSVIIKAEITDDWSAGVEYLPSNIKYSVKHGSDDPCAIGFDISMSDPLLTADQFGPWRSEWQLLEDETTVINQGIITKTQPVANDRVQVSGEDYLTYLKKRIYPFDYTTFSDAAAGTPFVVGIGDARGTNGYVDQIIYDLISDVEALSNTLGITVASSGTFEQLVSYTILPGDTTTIFDHLSTLAQQDGQLGFEYYVDINKILWIYADRYDPGPSRYLNLLDADIVSMDWANNGVIASVEIGFGVYHEMSSQYVSSATMTRYRRLEDIQEFGDSYIQQAPIDALTAAWGKLNAFPQHEVTITVYPERIIGPSDFILEHAGVVLNLDVDFFEPFHNIGGFMYRANQMDFTLSNEGDDIVEIELEQAYETVP
jgi:hypothetical protein